MNGEAMRANGIYLGDCLALMATMETGSVDLTFTSGPYEDCRLYAELKFKVRGQAWVDWMIPRVVEMCRVTNGLVFINAAGKVRQWKYSPVVEWLVADLTRHHGLVCGPSPYVFQRYGIPGSGSKHYHRRDWEPVYSFARPECLPVRWSANTELGKPPRFGPGGAMSHRLTNGSRVNQWGGTKGKTKDARAKNGSTATKPRPSHVFTTPSQTQRQNGEKCQGSYKPPTIANPGNVIDCGSVGGGRMGSDYAHDNEAPFPLQLSEFFVRSYLAPDGIGFDPMCGSGTFLHACEKWGRKYIGIDIRQSQVELSRRRVAEVEKPLFKEHA